MEWNYKKYPHNVFFFLILAKHTIADSPEEFVQSLKKFYSKIFLPFGQGD